MRFLAPFLIAVISVAAPAQSTTVHAAKLQLQVYVADARSFHVTSTLIVGTSEVMLVDAQMAISHANRVADMIAATGKRLTAIVLTHPDEDHVFGLQALLARFPGTPVYMTAAGVAELQRKAPGYLKNVREMLRADAPDSVVLPQPLPSNRLAVDGEVVEVVPDLQGDVLRRTNSFVFVPSLGAVVAGDIVFNGVHPYLANSTFATRLAWREALDSIDARKPRVLVPGHKPSAAAPNDPAALRFMADYIRDFDDLRRSTTNAPEMIAAMRAKYPALLLPDLMESSVQDSFARTRP